MTTQLATAEGESAFGQIKDLIYKQKAKLEEILPREVPADRFIRVSLVAIFKNPVLAKCHPLSIAQGLMEAAELGLEPTGLIGGGWLVPFKNKQGHYVAQFIASYHGLIVLALQDGLYETVEAHLVRRDDHFRFIRGGTPVLQHEADPEGESEIIGAYAIARRPSGSWQAEYMTVRQLEEIRKKSKAKDNGPWVTDKPEMYRKTAVRRLFKYLGVSSPKVRRLIQVEDAIEETSVMEGGEPIQSKAESVRARIAARRGTEPASMAEPEEDIEALMDRLSDSEIPVEEPKGKKRDYSVLFAVMKDKGIKAEKIEGHTHAHFPVAVLEACGWEDPVEGVPRLLSDMDQAEIDKAVAALRKL